MHRLTVRILGESNALHNTNTLINEIVCVSPPPYYLDFFEKYYLNVPLNWYDGPFFLQCINGIQRTNPEVRNCNILLDVAVKILKYTKITIDYAIYIKFFPMVLSPIVQYLPMML